MYIILMHAFELYTSALRIFTVHESNIVCVCVCVCVCACVRACVRACVHSHYCNKMYGMLSVHGSM